MNRKNTILGIKYPIGSDGIQMNTTTKEQVRSDINVLLSTQLGSRYMMPYFGIDLTRFLFEPLTDDTTNNIITEVSEAIQKFIFGVQVSNVTVVIDETRNCIGVNLQYKITDGFVEEQDFVEITF